MTLTVDLQTECGAQGCTLSWTSQGLPLLAASQPVILETVGPGLRDPGRTVTGYGSFVQRTPTELVGTAEIADPHGSRYVLTDRWTRIDPGHWRVDRELEVVEAAAGAGVRLVLEVSPAAAGGSEFEDYRYFAPGAIYDLNDLDGDHVNDYLDTRCMLYRDDRLAAMSFLAYHPASGLALSLSRADVPAFDPPPDRERGQATFLQRTDIGSLGISPAPESGQGCLLTGAYPFAERDRSYGLLLQERPPWETYWPVEPGDTLSVSYLIGLETSASPQEALWALWLRRMEDLRPRPVELGASLDVITGHRIDALRDYYAEDAATAAGFVTNCHPQDGEQLSNVIQYGFTGQTLLNAHCLLRAADAEHGDEDRRRALKVVDFFVEDAQRSPHGLVHGLYNMDLGRYSSWWMGVLLPLSYAEPGHDLEALMGPLYDRFRPVIERLQDREGTYLRCMAEEYDALLQAYELERENGTVHTAWLDAAESFARFLAAVQEPDGSWFRAYDFDGRAVTEPDFWFGQTDVQQKSSTATAVPFLLRLHAVTGDERWIEPARRAAGFVYERFVDGLKFNGGVQDSFYAKPQAVDHESIIFCFRALLELHRATGERSFLDQAVKAAWIVCTWAWLWDVPLPPESTFARFGFRSTGWTGCDVGAGYIHPMGVVVVPDLVEIARLSGDRAFARMAELILAACNENVALPEKDWGYARPGLQEEGQLISWCWADDPMFDDTAFGGRGKGEGNKTCYPWISAVGIWSQQELVARYGTDDVWEAMEAPRRLAAGSAA
jgi:hypothetical protein